MVLYDSGRGPYDKKLQIPAVEHSFDVPFLSTPPFDWDAIAEQFDRALGTSTVPDVGNQFC